MMSLTTNKSVAKTEEGDVDPGSCHYQNDIDDLDFSER